jgi:hypothetical protein
MDTCRYNKFLMCAKVQAVRNRMNGRTHPRPADQPTILHTGSHCNRATPSGLTPCVVGESQLTQNDSTSAWLHTVQFSAIGKYELPVRRNGAKSGQRRRFAVPRKRCLFCVTIIITRSVDGTACHLRVCVRARVNGPTRFNERLNVFACVCNKPLLRRRRRHRRSTSRSSGRGSSSISSSSSNSHGDVKM